MAAEQAPALTVCDQWDDGTATVTVRGEIDAATVDAFYQRLADVAGQPPAAGHRPGRCRLPRLRRAAGVRPAPQGTPRALPRHPALPAPPDPAGLRADRSGHRIRVRVAAGRTAPRPSGAGPAGMRDENGRGRRPDRRKGQVPRPSTAPRVAPAGFHPARSGTFGPWPAAFPASRSSGLARPDGNARK